MLLFLLPLLLLWVVATGKAAARAELRRRGNLADIDVPVVSQQELATAGEDRASDGWSCFPGQHFCVLLQKAWLLWLAPPKSRQPVATCAPPTYLTGVVCDASRSPEGHPPHQARGLAHLRARRPVCAAGQRTRPKDTGGRQQGLGGGRAGPGLGQRVRRLWLAAPQNCRQQVLNAAAAVAGRARCSPAAVPACL